VRDRGGEHRAVEATGARTRDDVHDDSPVLGATGGSQQLPPEFGNLLVVFARCCSTRRGDPAGQVDLVGDTRHPHRKADSAVHHQCEANLVFEHLPSIVSTWPIRLLG
jgi:hypothetical protein